MRSPVAALLVLVMVATAAARPPDVPRPRIVNGVYTSDYPTVGLLLEGGSADTADTQCTGTMIGCRTFLTAAHCVCDGAGSRCQGTTAPDPGRFFVFLQHAGVFAVEDVAVHPAYVFPWADLAVVRLAAPVSGITPTPINTSATPAFGTPGVVVGFGRSGLGAYDYGLKRRGSMTTAACDGDPTDPTWVCWDFEAPLGAPGTDANICNGDSGGPLFTAAACGDQLAGVTSGALDDECAPPDRPFDTNVFHYRDWIASHAGADLDAASCGAVRQLGESGSDWDGFVGTLGPGDAEGAHAVVVPAGAAELRVTMNAVDGAGENFDLYVRHGAAPTTAVFDCADTGASQFADCVLPAPAPGTWHLLARRVSGGGVYQITATTIGAGAPGTTGGAACSDGDACTVADACLRGRCVGATAPDGTSCDDGLACTAADACAAGACTGVATPLPACGGAASRASTLVLQRDAVDAGRDQLTWKWARGTIAPGALGAPDTVTPYTLCVFDHVAGTPALRLESTVPPGPGWSPSGSGWRYKDKRGEHGGITGITLRSGVGKGVVKLAAKGALVGVPSLPLAVDPRVTVQLSTSAACWEARYTTPSRHDARRFQAKSE